MRIRFQAMIALGALTLVGCESGGTASLDTDDQKASYAIGLNVGESLKETRSHLEMDALMRGIEDALAERDPSLTPEEVQTAMNRVRELIHEEQQSQRAASSERNRAEGEAYLAENAAKEAVITTDSGLQYEVLRQGDGPVPMPTDRVTLHYKGTLIDGTEFDSSYTRGQPATFSVGGVIAGFSEGIQLMPVGSHYRLSIPSDLAYGPQGSGGSIGPDAALVFEIELLEIN